MSIEDEAKSVLEKLGLHWPDGDPGKLRSAAGAWRTFAGKVDDVRTPVDNAAKTLIHHNKGEAIDAFETFWKRYADDGGKGWLKDLADSARKMADALDKLAGAIDDATDRLWTEIGIDAAVIVGGVALSFFTAGLSDAAAVAAADAIIELGGTVGVAISTTVAEVAAGALVAAAFGGVESVALDAAVAQPIRIAAGQQHGFSLDEVNEAAKSGMITGAVLGGAGAGLRPHLTEEGAAARAADDIPCKGEPVDVASGAMLMSQTDLSLPGSLPLTFTRTHLSSYRAGVCFGPTWISTLDERIQLDEQGVVFAAADGMRLVYPVPEPEAEVLPSKGPLWPLEWDGKPDGVMTVTDPSTGIVRTFGRPVSVDEPGAVHLPLEAWQDRNGARVEVERTADGIPVALRHSGGYYVAVDTEGPRITALRLLDGAPSAYGAEPDRTGGTTVVRYRYDARGNLVELVNSSGRPMRYTYDDEGRMLSWTDRKGTSFAYEYDASGRVVRTEGSEGVFNGSFAYDDAARTTVYTDSLGMRTVCRYNADGQVVEETDPLGHVTRTEWDERGLRPLASTDPLGHTTRYAYDAAGDLASVTLPDGSTARATYNALRQPVEVTEPDGARWRHAYDSLGNLLSVTDPSGATTRYAYTDRGHLASVTDPLGGTRRIVCDAAGLPVSVTDALGHTETVRRDAFGRVVETTDGLGHTTVTGWTTEGRPSWREDADGAREHWSWDGEGNLLAHTDPAGHTTRHTYGHFDVPASRTDPDGASYSFAYDTERRLTEVTGPHGLSWTYAYDAAGGLVAETDFDGRTVAYELDAAGAVAARTNGAGETLRYTRDPAGRVVEQRDDGGDLTTYAYDPAGRLASAANPDAELVLERDALGRVVAETVNGPTVRYAYDAMGRRTRRTTPAGITSEWTWDARGLPLELTTSWGGLGAGGHGRGRLVFTHDAAGREVGRRLGDSASLDQEWDAAGRLTAQSVTSAADRLLQHRAYAYRPDGHLTEIRELTSGTRRFGLDPMGRVTGVSAHGWTESYAYDASGNLTSATAPAHEAAGEREFTGTRIRRAGRTSYTHDAQGRLTRRTRGLLNGQTRVWSYEWSAEDRLVAATTPEGERWTYAYDPLGRRLSKRCDERVLSFVWDGTRLAEQTTHDGKSTTWDYAPDTHRPLTQTDHRTGTGPDSGASLLTKLADTGASSPAPVFHAVITDPVGTPTELVTSEGELAWQHRTAVWGTPLPAPPGAADCPLRFPGQYADPETGLHYNYFRHYDPETARYASPDPLGLDPAPNPVAYVPNVFGWADPLGLAPRGPKDPLDLGQGYRGRMDTWPEGTKGTDFEIHVYDKTGREVGIFGSDGFFDKHSKKATDIDVPDGVKNALKGKSVDFMRRTGRIGPKGTEDITGDKWKRPRLSTEGTGCK